MSNARQLMLDAQPDPKEYREIREEYKGKIRKLETEITEMTVMDSFVKDQLVFCGELLPNLTKYYTEADLPVKQQIFGSIYPEKLIFEDGAYRTTKVNEVVLWMFRLGKGSDGLQNKECSEKSEHSTSVPHSEITSNRFWQDLNLIYRLKHLIIKLL